MSIELKVRKERSGPVLGRHPWVFSGALLKIPDGIESGTPVKLFTEDNKYLAGGYFNSYSQIAVRIWSYDENEEVNQEFFTKRIKGAYELRRKYLEDKNTDSFRLINAENDFLPGLIVDKYADYLVIQCHTRGIEKWKSEITEALEKVLKPKGIFERSDVSVRRAENLEDKKGILSGKVPDLITIRENGYKFLVDVKEGQKTGFFLDQRDKRLAFQKYCQAKNVLNCFSYTGGFSVYALAGGAKKVTSADVSAKALDIAKENVKLNKLDLKKCEFVAADVKNYLAEAAPGSFEAIVLDPPAFIKDRRKIQEGMVGYKKINELAMKILPAGGILVSCSCSAHLPLRDFRYLLSECGGRSGRSLQLLETFTHGLDHPQLIPFTESEYLKVLFMSVR